MTFDKPFRNGMKHDAKKKKKIIKTETNRGKISLTEKNIVQWITQQLVKKWCTRLKKNLKTRIK